MALNIYISAVANPRGSIVISQSNPVAQSFRDLVLGDVHAVNLYLVDGVGGYDSRSGSAGSSVKAAIGTPGATPVWVNSSWTIITNGWSGQIAANTQALASLFTAGTNPVELELEIQVTDASGNPIAFANPLIKIWQRLINTNSLSTNPFVNAGDGEYAIPNAADTGSVTGLALSLVPRRVFLSVRKPIGGNAIFASVVAGSISTDGFNFDLSAQTDSANYKLDYILLY